MTISSIIHFRATPAFAGAPIRYIRARRKARVLIDARDMRASEQTLLWLTNLRTSIAQAGLK